jgi:hypothetical protein
MADDLANDLIGGVPAIAAFLGFSQRQTTPAATIGLTLDWLSGCAGPFWRIGGFPVHSASCSNPTPWLATRSRTASPIWHTISANMASR